MPHHRQVALPSRLQDRRRRAGAGGILEQGLTGQGRRRHPAAILGLCQRAPRAGRAQRSPAPDSRPAAGTDRWPGDPRGIQRQGGDPMQLTTILNAYEQALVAADATYWNEDLYIADRAKWQETLLRQRRQTRDLER